MKVSRKKITETIFTHCNEVMYTDKERFLCDFEM